MKEKILNILNEIRPESEFGESNDFIEDDLLDSLDLIQLFDGLEEVFQIKLNSDDFEPENFKNLDTIMKMVQRETES